MTTGISAGETSTSIDIISIGAIVSSPVVDKGVVYFGSMDGNLCAL